MKNFLVGLITLLTIGSAALSILYVTGIYDVTSLFRNTNDGEGTFYVRFMDAYFLLDDDGVVLRCSSTQPEDIPEVQDMMYYNFVVGEVAAAKNEETFTYITNVCDLIDRYSVSISYISVSEDNEVILNINGDVSVNLGSEDEDTELKIKDLKDLYSKLTDLSGVLDMTEADTDGVGYTFKKSAE